MRFSIIQGSVWNLCGFFNLKRLRIKLLQVSYEKRFRNIPWDGIVVLTYHSGATSVLRQIRVNRLESMI
jgi:hypothetical protein